MCRHPWLSTPPGGSFDIIDRTHNSVNALVRYWNRKFGMWQAVRLGPRKFRVERIDDGPVERSNLMAPPMNVFSTPLNQLLRQVLTDAAARGPLLVLIDPKGECYTALPHQQIRNEYLACTVTGDTHVDRLAADIVARVDEILAARVRAQDHTDREQRWAAR